MQDDPIGNINLAMEIAEKHLDIPKMLDAEGESYILLKFVLLKAKPNKTSSVLCLADFQHSFHMDNNGATRFVFKQSFPSCSPFIG